MAVTGWFSPTTTGSPRNSWPLPTRLYTSDNIRNGVLADQSSQSYAGFNITIADLPAGSTVTDVEVSVEGGAAVAGNDSQISAMLVIGGVEQTLLEFGIGIYTLASDRYFANLATSVAGYVLPTDTEARAVDFGVTLKFYDLGGGASFLGDHVRIRIYYETAVVVTLDDTVTPADTISVSTSFPPGTEKVIVSVPYTEKSIPAGTICTERVIVTIPISGKTITSYIVTKKTMLTVSPTGKMIVSYSNTEKVIQ